MSEYNNFPAVDANYSFPEVVRRAIFGSPENKAHTENTSNPHKTTKEQVGLGFVDNTADVDKPVSTPQKQALDKKAPLDSPAFTGTPTGISKAHVGLGNVDNTADTEKPVSKLQRTELDKQARIKHIVELFTTTGNSSAITVIQNIPSFKFLANHWYEVEWTVGVVLQSGNPAQTPLAQIFTTPVTQPATSLIDITEITGFNIMFSAAGQTARVNAKRKIKYATDQTLQIKTVLNPNAGQSIWASSGQTFPAQLSIVDLGII